MLLHAILHALGSVSDLPQVTVDPFNHRRATMPEFLGDVEMQPLTAPLG